MTKTCNFEGRIFFFNSGKEAQPSILPRLLPSEEGNTPSLPIHPNLFCAFGHSSVHRSLAPTALRSCVAYLYIFLRTGHGARWRFHRFAVEKKFAHQTSETKFIIAVTEFVVLRLVMFICLLSVVALCTFFSVIHAPDWARLSWLPVGFRACFLCVGIDVARFNGSSYIVFPPLDVTSRTLVISVELRPESANGLLLYNANIRSRFKDFIAITLTRGHLELRFLALSRP